LLTQPEDCLLFRSLTAAVFEWNNWHSGDGGFVAKFSDGMVTNSMWKAQSFYIAPLGPAPPRAPRARRSGLVAAGKIHCEFLALDRWQVEGKQCSVGHDGCGARLIRDAIRRNTDLLRESLALRHSRHINLMPRA
jgi:hypothetical protein